VLRRPQGKPILEASTGVSQDADMPQDPETTGRSGSWWSTLPGMLTGAAGLITAVTALIVAVNGLLGDPDEPQASNRPAAGVSAETTEGVTTKIRAATPTTPKTDQAATYHVTFPGPTRVTAQRRSGHGVDATYDFLSATAEPRNPGELTLATTVRSTATGDVDANFYSGDFRLRVGATNRAPVNFFSEIVLTKTSMEKMLQFAVPDSPGTFTLIVLNGDDEFEVPVAMRRR
jgi:hypothetical protein